MKKKLITLLFLIAGYNLIFYLQQVIQSELQLYFLGFRLNLFLALNILLIYWNKEHLEVILNDLKRTGKLKHWLTAFLIPILSILIMTFLFFIYNEIKFKKPEFLIEFAGTAFIDLPIYYLWNLPFVLSTLVLIKIMNQNSGFIRTFVISILFGMGFITFGLGDFTKKIVLEKFLYLVLIISFTFFVLSVFKYTDSYWITILTFFSFLYSFVLISGSKNSFLIKTFFARQYSSWEGLIKIKGDNLIYFNLIVAGWMLFLGILFFIFDKRKNSLK